MFFKDNWLSNYFAKGVYKYSASGAEPTYPNGFIFTKISSGQESQLNALLADGFMLAEILIQFEQKELMDCSSNFKINRARKSDEKDVRDIASKAFISSRLYQDPAVPNQVASQIKSDWAGNFFSGKRGDAMVVARDNGSVIGFLLLIGNVIDLIAVSEDYKKKGIARAMLAFANQDRGLLTAGTQLTNKSSIAFYQSSNFILKDAQYVLHKHQEAVSS